MKTLALWLLWLLLFVAETAHAQDKKGNPAMPCFRALADDARFASIRGKVALGPDRDSETQRLARITERASEQDKPLLATWRSAREACHQKELPYYATRDSEIALLARRHFDAVQSLIGELRDAKITYGEFSTRRAALYEKVNRDIDEVRRSILPAKPISPMPTST
jgi:hypothetical protein